MMISDKEKGKWERVGKKSGGHGEQICSYCKTPRHDSDNCFSKNGYPKTWVDQRECLSAEKRGISV